MVQEQANAPWTFRMREEVHELHELTCETRIWHLRCTQIRARKIATPGA